jgi:hypothetical protein
MRRIVTIAISVVLALVVAVPMALGQTAPPEQEPAQGKTEKNPSKKDQNLADLTEAWWTWALQEPSPAVGSYTDGQQCEGEFVDGVFFLAGTLGGGDAKRSCTVPADTALFFPVVNFFCTADEPNYPECATDPVDAALATGEPYATLDGKNLKISRITTEPFTLILPEPNIFGLPAGPYEHLAVSDGLWVYLPQGLKPGEYTLEFGGDFPNSPQNITYELTVV